MKPPANSSKARINRHVLGVVLAATILPLAAAQTATVSPTGLPFLTQVIGTTSAAKTATLTNTGTVSLSITSFTTSGDFAQTNNCGSSLAGGAKCTINVTFTPTVIGTRTGTLSINDNASSSPQTVSLSGSGTIVSLSPTALGFGSVAVGGSAVQTVTLSNANSTATLKITGVSFSGTNASDFSQTNTCGSSLPPSASCSITVTFKPAAIGTRRASLNVSDNGGASPQSVSLTGTGTAATLLSIAVTPANPSVAAGQTQQFTATGTYSDGSTQNLTTSASWSSSNTAVATISNASGTQGLATSTTQGSATITATSGSVSGSTTLTVGPAVLLSLAITPANPAIALGTTQQLTATGTYSDGSTQNLTASATWSSSNTGVATISNSPGTQGLATSVATGTTTITAISGSISTTTVLTVNLAVVVSIAVTPAIPSIPAGTTQQFTATGTFSDGSTQNITQTVQWSSSTSTVATISNASGSQGLATSVATGSTTITATSGSVSGSSTLTVTAAALISIAMTPVNSTIGSGATQQFTATGSYTDGSKQNLTNSATWASSTTSVATISSTGLATAVAAGTTTISATSGSITGSTTLTVSSATLVSIAINPVNPSVALGTTQQFTATGTYSDGSTQNLTSSTFWTSSALNVATISDSSPTIGLATSTGTGTATITATSGSVSGTTTLTVTPATLVSIAITPANPSIALGTTQQFTATGTFTDGSTQNLTTTVSWGSSSTTVAVISNSTGSQGLATSAAVGTTTITATSGSVSGSTLLTVGNPQLVSLAVTPNNPTIAQGGTEQFTATGTYTDGSTQNLTTAVTWTSSNTTVATINTTGLATGLFGGTTTISATSGSITNSTSLTVTPGSAVLSSITLTPSNPAISVAGNQQFTATGNYSDGSTQDLTTFANWTSSSSAIATIQTTGQSTPGMLTGVAAGIATITATYTGISGSLSVTIAVNNIKIPIMDMTAAQNYYGFQGGLYENVSNIVPADHDTDGKTFAAQVIPLNNGTKNAIVLLGIGQSIAGDEMSQVVKDWPVTPGMNTQTLKLVNGAQGGATACVWSYAFRAPTACNNPVWTTNLYDFLESQFFTKTGYTESQVEVVYYESVERCPTTGSLPSPNADAYVYEGYSGAVARALKQRYPNIKLLVMTPRNYGGYDKECTSPEPYAYEEGFAVKWLTQAQITQIRTGNIDPIAGDLSYASAPWMIWAAYTWADGPNPRSDGLVWCDGQTGPPCNGEVDFQSDGLHPTSTGQIKLGNMLMNFYMNSPYATPWSLAPAP